MNTDIVPHGESDFGDYPERAAEAPAVNPLLLVHRCLRGRYVLAIALGAILAGPLAVLGYNAVPPKYTSTGRINIAPTRPYILYENEFTERLSSFESFVQAQANTLKSQRVLAKASTNAEFRDAGWEPLPQGLIDLIEATSVSVPRGGQDIFVRVTWTDPKLAQVATNAILDEYSRIAIDLEASQNQKTIDTVENLREEARRERDEARSRAYQIAEVQGTDDLAKRREAKHAEGERIEQLLLDVNYQLLPYESGGASASDQPGDGGTLPAPEIPLEALAANDRELGAMLGRRLELQIQISSLQQVFGENHRRVSALQDELDNLGPMIDARAAAARAAFPGAAVAVPIEVQLRVRRAWLEEMQLAAVQEARNYGKLQLDIDRLREEADRADEKFREADARLESLLVQKHDGQQGRISIEERAETPLSPSTDRRIPLAALGAIGGGGMGVGFVMLFGLLNPRYRFVDDIESGKQRLQIMGAIPEIDADDPVAREFVAASVHQIRTAIDAQLLGPGGRGRVHVVTSASAGEGKSTLSLRLARSFAGSGKRTVLIDADLVGRHVTSKFGIANTPGFADAAVDGVDPVDAVHGTEEHNLFLMPAGNHSERTPAHVSVAGVSRVLESLRHDFGAIVIDTGPILGSIEAQAIVAASDEVLVVVSRGTGVRLVRLALDRLSRLGSARLGVVFNRATMADLERSTSISMTSRRTSEPIGAVSVAGTYSNGNGADHREVAD